MTYIKLIVKIILTSFKIFILSIIYILTRPFMRLLMKGNKL